MSENNNIQNEEELWDLISDPAKAEQKAPKAKPAPKSEPAPAAEAPKSGRKIDGFFLACMAGVAAVSVAATLLIGSMSGGTPADPAVKDPNAGGDVSISETASDYVAQLERENAELRAKLEQQTSQIKDLQNDLITLMGSEEYLSSAATDPSGVSEVQDAQLKALDTFAQIQEAYADFDREKLEELIPQMDEQLSYLTPEMLNSYYLILEYVEQPSNG